MKIPFYWDIEKKCYPVKKMTRKQEDLLDFFIQSEVGFKGIFEQYHWTREQQWHGVGHLAESLNSRDYRKQGRLRFKFIEYAESTLAFLKARPYFNPYPKIGHLSVPIIETCIGAVEQLAVERRWACEYIPFHTTEDVIAVICNIRGRRSAEFWGGRQFGRTLIPLMNTLVRKLYSCDEAMSFLANYAEYIHNPEERDARASRIWKLWQDENRAAENGPGQQS